MEHIETKMGRRLCLITKSEVVQVTRKEVNRFIGEQELCKKCLGLVFEAQTRQVEGDLPVEGPREEE